MAQQPAPSLWSRLPSMVWIVIFVVGIVALIGGIVGLFWLLANVEGAASIIMLLAGWGTIRVGSSLDNLPSKGQRFMVAVGISFFALMGLAIDQTGNYLYNRPLEWFFCPDGTQVERGVEVTNPLPGQTNITQEFTCVKPDHQQPMKGISTGRVMAVRLGEYILIGYALVWINRLYVRFRRARPTPVQ